MRSSAKKLMNLLSENRQEILPISAWFALILWTPMLYHVFEGTAGHVPALVAEMALIVAVGRYVSEGVDYVKLKRETREQVRREQAIITGINEVLREQHGKRRW